MWTQVMSISFFLFFFSLSSLFPPPLRSDPIPTNFPPYINQLAGVTHGGEGGSCGFFVLRSASISDERSLHQLPKKETKKFILEPFGWSFWFIHEVKKSDDWRGFRLEGRCVQSVKRMEEKKKDISYIKCTMNYLETWALLSRCSSNEDEVLEQTAPICFGKGRRATFPQIKDPIRASRNASVAYLSIFYLHVF